MKIIPLTSQCQNSIPLPLFIPTTKLFYLPVSDITIPLSDTPPKIPSLTIQVLLFGEDGEDCSNGNLPNY